MATLHNQDQVRLKDVRPGDLVVVRKAGDVIPEVVGPVLSERPKGLAEWEFPTVCPCPVASALERAEGEADTRCVEATCPFQRDQRIIYWASRGAMDIEGLGERTVAQLTAAGLAADVADLYAPLTAEQVESLEGFARVSAEKLVAGIDGSRDRPAWRVLTGFGIKHLGPTAAQSLAAALGGVREVLEASEERRAEVAGVGQVISASVSDWWSREAHRDLVDRLERHGVDLRVSEGPIVSDLPATLEGRAVVVTGRFRGTPVRALRRRCSPEAARHRGVSVRRPLPSWSAMERAPRNSPRPSPSAFPLSRPTASTSCSSRVRSRPEASTLWLRSLSSDDHELPGERSGSLSTLVDSPVDHLNAVHPGVEARHRPVRRRGVGERRVAGFEHGHWGNRDLFPGLDRACLHLRQIDRWDLDSVDHQHPGVTGREVDEDVRLGEGLLGVGDGGDALDRRWQVAALIAGHRHEEAAGDEHEPDRDHRADEQKGGSTRRRAGAGESASAVASGSLPLT